MQPYILRTSAFESLAFDPVTHIESRWMIAYDAAFTLLLVDTWFSAANLEQYSFVWEYQTPFYAKVQHRDSFGIVSDWSDTLVVVPIKKKVSKTVELPDQKLNELRLGPLLQPSDIQRATVELEDKINEIIRFIRTLQQ